ncbi:hypothetical protein FB567DRAFT_32568 [Paraphoma chrysanthemicola]|uniref:LysR family regulatory protein n=1 Tax=Paraphoma chrysanthemicola TaxID=798071 RepID=A0A8K0RJD9_9PLEO|nr:hypothetical protein FB567DRAFT_32568 [Paraphoma chrysanthemicola]
MSFLSNLFRSKHVAPERAATDTVIPLFSRDDTRTNKQIMLEFTMKFDDVMDAEKLSGALWKLLERPGWRKLGARLRRNDKGKLEYHIPAQYTKARPPINYTHIVESMPLSKHALHASFPKATGKLQAFDDIGRVTAKSATNPERFEDYISLDIPQIGLQIMSFDDATLVTITWLHTLLDAMGQDALIRAWIAVLEGRDSDVPDFAGYDTDPLATLGNTDISPQEEFVLAPKLLKGLSMLQFVFNYIWETYFFPEEVSRLMCMPGSYFSRIQTQAYADLSTLPASELTYNTTAADGDKRPFISDGDIITAWFIQLIAATNPTLTSYPNRLVGVMNVLDLRNVLSTTSSPLLPPSAAYVHNSVSSIWSHFTVSQLHSLPLGHVAARIRQDLVSQTTRAQVEACARTTQQNGGTALYGNGGMALSTMSNWSKSRVFDLDFSTAIAEGTKGTSNGESRSEKTSGKPVSIHIVGRNAPGLALRGSGMCIGRDAAGNWWLGAVMRKEAEEMFKKVIEGMN